MALSQDLIPVFDNPQYFWNATDGEPLVEQLSVNDAVCTAHHSSGGASAPEDAYRDDVVSIVDALRGASASESVDSFLGVFGGMSPEKGLGEGLFFQ